jgi:hypothetical protein
LSSDLFDVFLPFLCGTKFDFLDFPGESTPTLKDKTTKLAKSSKMTIQRSWPPRGLCPPTLEEQMAFSHLRQFKRTAQLRGLLQIQMESITQTSKSSQSWDILSRGSYTCALIFKPSRLLAKGKLISLAKAIFLSKGSITFNGMQLLLRDTVESSFCTELTHWYLLSNWTDMYPLVCMTPNVDISPKESALNYPL